MRFPSVLRPKFFGRKKSKLDQPKAVKDQTVTFEPKSNPQDRPKKAPRPRTKLDRAFNGITGYTSTLARWQKSKKNTVGEGVSHRHDPSVRRHDENGVGQGPVTRMSPKRSTSKYMPWVEDAKHRKNRERAERKHGYTDCRDWSVDEGRCGECIGCVHDEEMRAEAHEMEVLA